MSKDYLSFWKWLASKLRLFFSGGLCLQTIESQNQSRLQTDKHVRDELNIGLRAGVDRAH